MFRSRSLDLDEVIVADQSGAGKCEYLIADPRDLLLLAGP